MSESGRSEFGSVTERLYFGIERKISHKKAQEEFSYKEAQKCSKVNAYEICKSQSGFAARRTSFRVSPLRVAKKDPLS